MPTSDRSLLVLSESLVETRACEARPGRVVDSEQVSVGELCVCVAAAHNRGPFGRCSSCGSPWPCEAYSSALAFALEQVILATTKIVRGRRTTPRSATSPQAQRNVPLT